MQCCDNINCHKQGQICIPASKIPRIVVIGGGFAGLNLVKNLQNMPVQVLMIDKNNFHQFSPLLYQVATSGIEPDNLAFPFRKLFDDYRNVVFRMAKAIKSDPVKRLLHTSIGSVEYDYLVLAMGSTTNYFGNSGFEDFGHGLKSITDALDIRSHLLQNLEKAAVTCIKEEKETLSSIAIVGGGSAGVEMAGALAEFKRDILPKDYPELKNIEMKISLLEGVDRLLYYMPKSLSKKTFNYLTDLNVNVVLNSTVKTYDGSTVTLNNGETLNASTFIWTAGVKGSGIEGIPQDALNKQHRILVDAYGRIQSLGNVFAIGDNAQLSTEKYPYGHPMVAQSAIQQGKTLASNIMRTINKQQLVPFEYKNKGSLATIGKKKAVAKIKNQEFSGFFAWLIWSFVHLMGIVGVRNKLLIVVNLWNYITYDRGNRLIIRRYKEKNEEIKTKPHILNN